MSSDEVRQNVIAKAKRVVVKVGTSAISDDTGRLDEAAVDSLAGQIAGAMASGVSVTVVSSGAIAAGLSELGLAERPKTMPMLQACAAVGQVRLMRCFRDAFARRDVHVAQVLLTRDDFEDRSRYLNIRNTLTTLVECGALVIINENDAVAVEEIRYGDNDILAAHVANMLGADVLVMLSNVDGVMRDGTVLDVIRRLDERTMALAAGEQSRLGSGGMTTKLQAADMVTRAGEAAVIANSRTPDVLTRLLAGQRVGTVVVPAGPKMARRRRWIGQAARAAGKIVVDEGAARALTEGGKSLLPSGIQGVSGKFEKGATVAVIDSEGRQIARGLTNYSAEQIEKIKGLKSSRIAGILGDKAYDEVIHRNNMTLG
jgi:glutamate 5-kinase